MFKSIKRQGNSYNIGILCTKDECTEDTVYSRKKFENRGHDLLELVYNAV